MIDPREPVRKTIVKSGRIERFKQGDLLFPNSEFWEREGRPAPQEVWIVFLDFQTGFLPPRSRMAVFVSQTKAEEYLKGFPTGSEIIVGPKSPVFLKGGIREELQAYIDQGLVGWSNNAGDDESPLAFEVLGDAELTEGRFGNVSPKVTTWLGKQRLGVLKHKHRDNWTAAAIFEYCYFNLPESSPAFAAAAYKYHHYIAQDDFAAGYWWRDLEILVLGVEAAALATQETRDKAGKAGGKASGSARNERRAALLDAMEAVAERNPDILVLGPKPVSKIALGECETNNPNLWSQGGGQVSEYLGEIRRGEAGEEMKARYLALFPLKPPKRSRR